MVVAIKRDTATLEELVDARLEDMGIAEMDAGLEIRDAAKAYYLELLKGHLENTYDVDVEGFIEDYEGEVWGFVEGYSKAYSKHRRTMH